MAQVTSEEAEKDRDFIAALVFCALSAYSLVFLVRSPDPYLRLQIGSSIPINMLAGYSFLTRRPPVEQTARGEYTVPLISFVMPFFILNAGTFISLEYSFRFGAVVGLAGAALAIVSLAYLRDSFAILPAVRGIVDRGPYRLVRHPLYMAEMAYVAGFMLAGLNTLSLILFVVLVASTVWRILIEERKLGKYPEYRSYAAVVRYRLVPGLF